MRRNMHLARDRSKSRSRPEVGALDFDPVIAAQDGKADNLKIGQPILLDDRAELEVQFRNGEEMTLYCTLVKEHGGWKVEDIANQQGEEPWSLSALLGDAQQAALSARHVIAAKPAFGQRRAPKATGLY